jgi:hypothetical protein
LWDRDSGTLFAIVKESEFDPGRVALATDYVLYLLRHRSPELPPWFVSGVMTLFAQARFSEDALTLERLVWPAKPGSAVLKSGADANQELLPLAQFFAGPASQEAVSLWQAQAALLVRWGLGGRGAPRRVALWKFVDRAAAGEATEALFRECFDLDFAAADKALGEYLLEAQRDRLALRPAQRPRLADIPLRPATDVEVARIKGDWERLEIGYVKTQFPVLESKYVEQARRTLKRAYDSGSRDARLLAVMGLCEIDAGNEPAARQFLEAAAASGQALRPRAGYELARLRFAALRTGRDAAAITATQAAGLLALLDTVRQQEPPLAEAYELISEVWAAAAHAPTPEQLSVLAEGVRLFPRRSELVYRTAELHLRHGFDDAAGWLITLGLTLAPDAAARARFEALQARNAR